MAKLITKYVCQSCGAVSLRLQGKCDQCGEWNTLVETIEEKKTGVKSTKKVRGVEVQKLNQVKGDEFSRSKTGISEFDRVLGGGIVPGSLVLIGGDPGIGKSTLILQIADRLGTVLYASGEESPHQVKLRADRMGVVSNDISLLSETNIEAIIDTAKNEKPNHLIVDSIQTMWSEELVGSTGGEGQVSLCT